MIPNPPAARLQVVLVFLGWTRASERSNIDLGELRRMTARRTQLITAAAGMGGVVLLVAEFVTWKNPQFDDHLATITNYFVTNKSMALASLELGLAASVVLLIFAAGLRSILLSAEGGDILSNIFFGGAILYVSTEIGFLTTTGALVYVAGHGAESEIRLLLALENWADQFRFLPAGILIAAASAAMIDGRILGGWIRWLGIASGALLLVSEVANLDPLGPLGGVSNAGILGLLLFLIWIVAVSVSLIRRPVAPASSQRPAIAGHAHV